MIKKIIILTIVLTLSSCALFRKQSESTPRVEVVKGQWIQLPTPAALAFNGQASQILTGIYHIKGKIQTYTSQVEIEKTPHKLVLVALSGLGGELFSLVYNGITLKSSSLPMPNAAMGIKHTLTDFIFTYAPKSLLQSILSHTDITLQATPLKRIFYLDSKPIIQITYQYKNPWHGHITYKNLTLHYTVRISTTSYKRMSN
jgi:hypothetical protein